MPFSGFRRFVFPMGVVKPDQEKRLCCDTKQHGIPADKGRFGTHLQKK